MVLFNQTISLPHAMRSLCHDHLQQVMKAQTTLNIYLWLLNSSQGKLVNQAWLDVNNLGNTLKSSYHNTFNFFISPFNHPLPSSNHNKSPLLKLQNTRCLSLYLACDFFNHVLIVAWTCEIFFINLWAFYHSLHALPFAEVLLENTKPTN